VEKTMEKTTTEDEDFT